MQKHTLKQFNEMFSDDDACLEWLRNHLYPQKIYCLNCKLSRKHHRIRSRKVYGCDYCGHQVSPMAGTIFHKSRTSLVDWFYAIFKVSTTRTGYSAKQLEREIGVTYKTAWRMLNEIRKMLSEQAGLSVVRLK
ncbi:MAG: transposase [Chloroflexi bacterium]|nr:transposase [Chloroflexota bacterium]